MEKRWHWAGTGRGLDSNRVKAGNRESIRGIFLGTKRAGISFFP